jgi:protocatechuate 3,4-dioxygenase beta subunit
MMDAHPSRYLHATPAGLLLLLAGVIVAQAAHAQSTTAIPDGDANSGRFTNLTRGLSSLGEVDTHLAMAIPGDQATFTLELFDGDMGGKWDPGGGPAADAVTFALFADPMAANARSVLVTQWSSTAMPDNDWFCATVSNVPAALGDDGDYHYNLVASWATQLVANEQNNFKIRVEGLVYLLANSTYGFIGYGPNDPAPSLYPPTTYDGTWRFMLSVPVGVKTLSLWDGDLDRADDTDDARTPAFPPFPYPALTRAEGVAPGAPADDAAPASPLRLSPSIVVSLTAPGDAWTVVNDNPSGDKEWEVFRVSTQASANPHALVASLPAGLYEWQIHGADGRNTLFIAPRQDLYPELCSVGDRVWNDANANGLQDLDENGVPNVPVALFRGGDTSACATTATDAQGHYGFSNLLPGDYHVQFTVPDGWALTDPSVGGDGELDSDACLTDGRCSETTLLPRESDLTWDAGLYRLASIGDFAWNDANANGIQDSGEAGLPGVTVTLHDANGNQVGASVITDADGRYAFADLVPGSYSVVFGGLGGYVFTSQDAGGDDADSDAYPATGQTAVTPLTSGEQDVTWDAGLYQLASVGDYVWDDVNRNGIQDSGEVGLAGVTVTLYSSSGTQVAPASTDATGRYSFANLAPGAYYLVFGGKSGYAFSPQNQGSDQGLDSDASPADGKSATTTLVPGENDVTWDAGLAADPPHTSPPEITGWTSLATHGTAGEIGLDMADDAVEPRSSGLSRIRITFTEALDPATVSPAAISVIGVKSGDVSGLVQSTTLGQAGDVVTVVLAAPADVDRYTFAVSTALKCLAGGVPLAGDRDRVMVALKGDANRQRVVDVGDVTAVQVNVGKAVTLSTARCDLNRDGRINVSDVAVVGVNQGHRVP